MLENREKNLQQITELITDTKIEGAVNSFQFNVDDMIFFNHVNLQEILISLNTHHDTLYGMHLKLNPGVNYSHTTDRIIQMLPKFTFLGNYLTFDRTESELDWNYPFDFCGSIYLLDRVVSVL